MKSLVRWISAVVFSFVCYQAAAAPAPGTTAVLVHGAFADGSSWAKVIPLLQAQGLKVVAIQNPLTSLADDASAAKRAIANATGPVILVGHSWGGVVITEAGGDPKVKSLVYVAAFAPDAGQSVATVSQGYPTAPGLSSLVIDSFGFITLSEQTMMNDFAQDLPADQTRVMAVTQGPWSQTCLTDKVGAAAWKSKKSWFVVANQDRMILPQMQQDMAKKIGATTSSVDASHVPMISHPDVVAKAILDAASAP